MALSGQTIWEVRTAGNDTNGGGFVAGAAGSDYSQQDAKNTAGADISTTDAVADGSTTLTSATANFGTTIVGNIIYLQGGTGTLTATKREVTARASTTSITVDAIVAAGTGITMNIGGALASPGAAGTFAVANNKAFIKAGTYSITSATPNISGGCVSWPAASGDGSIGQIQGYQTTRTDLGTKPLLQASGISTFTLISLAGFKTMVVNIEVDGAGLTSSRGIANATNLPGLAFRCKASNCTNSGIATLTAILCEITGCSTVAACGSPMCYGCWVHDNTITAYFGSGTFTALSSYDFCIASDNSGATTDGFVLAGDRCVVTNCIAVNSGRSGFFGSNSGLAIFSLGNCLATGNGAYGFNVDETNGLGTIMVNCAGFSNTSGNVNGTVPHNYNFLALSSTPFTNAAADDFSLNNTAGGGAALRATGVPGAFPAGLTTGYVDIGAAQHQDSASGGSTVGITAQLV